MILSPIDEGLCIVPDCGNPRRFCSAACADELHGPAYPSSERIDRVSTVLYSLLRDCPAIPDGEADAWVDARSKVLDYIEGRE
mgnify:CR=1 FL=1